MLATSTYSASSSTGAPGGSQFSAGRTEHALANSLARRLAAASKGACQRRVRGRQMLGRRATRRASLPDC